MGEDEQAVGARTESLRVATAAEVDAYRDAVEAWCLGYQAIDAARLAALPRPPRTRPW